jgi:hypothetical protein
MFDARNTTDSYAYYNKVFVLRGPLACNEQHIFNNSTITQFMSQNLDSRDSALTDQKYLLLTYTGKFYCYCSLVVHRLDIHL